MLRARSFVLALAAAVSLGLLSDAAALASPSRATSAKQKLAKKKPAKKKTSKKSAKKATKKKTSGLPTYSKAFQKKYNTAASSDPDDDGLTSYYEYMAGTNPRKADSNGNGIDDGDEDRDKDGLLNLTEQDLRTNPGRRDTDGNRTSDANEDRDRDGLPNLAEQRTGNDPLDRDTDDDGIRDGLENVGRVMSYDSTTGAIRLWFSGQRREVKATLGADSSVLCSSMDDQETPGDLTGDEDYSDFENDTSSDDGVDAASVDESTDDGAYDTADDSEDDGTYDEADDEVVDDTIPGVDSCRDGVKKNVWFANAELVKNPQTGGMTIQLLELADN